MSELLSTSPSQLKVHEDQCPRKWWLKHVHGLLEPKRTSQNFGSATHKVIERYLKADATGRDPATGKAVELYPANWAQEFMLLPREADIIPRLIEMAIEKGVLYRPSSDYAVEREYFWNMPRVAAREHGFTDLLEVDRVSDHKTHSASRWALNVEELRTDWQMRAYALELVRIYREKNQSPPAEIALRHNVYVWKQEEKVFSREAVVTLADLETHEEAVHETVRNMISLKSIPLENWRDIPDSPRPGSDACNAYGGCPFQFICAGREAPLAYKIRMQNANKTPAQLAEEAKMIRPGLAGLLTKAAPVVTAPQPAVPFTQAPQIVPPAPTEARVEPPPFVPKAAIDVTHSTPPPPWRNPACVACSKNPFPGFDTNLRPCRICDAVRARSGERTSISYRSDVKDGAPRWWDPQIEEEGKRHPDDIAETSPGLERGAVPDMAAQLAKFRAEQAAASAPTPAVVTGEQTDAHPTIGEQIEQARTEQEQPEQTGRRGRPKGSKNKPKVPADEVIRTAADMEASLAREISEASGGIVIPAVDLEKLKQAVGPMPNMQQSARYDTEPRTVRFDFEMSGMAQEFKSMHARLDALTEAISKLTGVPVETSAPAVNQSGFTLAIGCVPPEGTPRLSFSHWQEKLRQECAAHFEVEDYFMADTFPRRDAICVAARRASKNIPDGAWLVVSRERDPDSNAVVSALRGLAIQIVE